MPFKFSANLSFMFQRESSDLLERYWLAKNAGFKGVEVAFPYDIDKDALAEIKKKSGVEQILLNAYPGKSLGFASLENKEEEFLESLKRSIEYCKALKCKRLHIMSGLQDSCNASEDVLINNLAKAIPLLMEADIIGLIEPINSYSLPNYFLNSFELGEKIVRHFDSPYLRLQLDIFHLQFLKGDLTNNIKRLLPIVGHIQIAQVPDRHEPDSEGEINYEYVLKMIEDCGYEGWIGLEYKAKNDTVEGLKWIEKFGYEL